MNASESTFAQCWTTRSKQGKLEERPIRRRLEAIRHDDARSTKWIKIMTTKTKKKRVKDRYLELVQCVPLRPIRSEGELDEAINMVNYLIDRERMTKDEKDYLDVLGGLIEAYEDEHIVFERQPDSEMLRFLIEAKGVTRPKPPRRAELPFRPFPQSSPARASSIADTSASCAGISTWGPASSSSGNEPSNLKILQQLPHARHAEQVHEGHQGQNERPLEQKNAAMKGRHARGMVAPWQAGNRRAGAIVGCCQDRNQLPARSRGMPFRAATFSRALTKASVDTVFEPNRSAWRSQRREMKPKQRNVYAAKSPSLPKLLSVFSVSQRSSAYWALTSRSTKS